MKDTKKYTPDEIQSAWINYQESWCFRYLKAGKQYISEAKPETSKEAVTKLERVRYRDVMSFPKFLKVKHG